MKFYARYLKRLFDIIFSSVMLVLLAPLMTLTALAIKLDSKGPAIILQERLGRDGKVFKLHKFRSMCVNAEKMGNGYYCPKDDPRVTRVGRFIRATSIDELPQLWNTLKGDMSIVGFRPPLAYHPWPYEDYSDEQRKMFTLRPGITGWAQVYGRKTVDWNHRIRIGCWYADNASLLIDMRIIFLTIGVVLRNVNNNEDEAIGTVPTKNTDNSTEGMTV